MTKEAELKRLQKERQDIVNHPTHYQLFPDLEVVQAIEKMLTPKEYRGYLKGNILKYRLRAGKKGADKTIEDIQKSMKYEEFLAETEIKSAANRAYKLEKESTND